MVVDSPEDGLTRRAAVADDAVRTAGRIVNSRFRSLLQLAAKGETGDIVTDVDIASETAIVAIIRSAFPEDSVRVEESSGHLTASRWTWVVDPLDGTNNYAFGLPVFGVSVAVCHDGQPVLACLAEGAGSSLVTGVRGGGVLVDGVRWTPPRYAAPRPSAALWVGYEVDRGGRGNLALLSMLARTTRRTFENWAPLVDVGLYLRGALDVVVGYCCSGTELPAALLVLREAGARVVGTDGEEISLADVPLVFLAGRPEAVDLLLGALREQPLDL